jgi:hypothetical protein
VAAADMVDAIVADGGFEGDVHAARRWVELRARSLLVTKWQAVQAIAEKLRMRKLLTADDVADICERAGVRPHGTITKAEAMAKMTPAGRRAVTGTVGADGKTIEKRSNPAAHLTEVDQQIAEIKAQLMGPGDDPALWPLRKKLASLGHKRQDLLAQ